jgi:hypothetical protein
MASITIDIDLPEGVTITTYQRLGEAHGFEVDDSVSEVLFFDGVEVDN